MLKFYYNPISVNARRVWIALLEKSVPFESIVIRLDGEQCSSEFTAINPLQRVPVLVDGETKVVESLAILDYLEAKSPIPTLVPHDIDAIAKLRIVETITVVELQPQTILLTRPMVGLSVDPQKLERTQQRVDRVLSFLQTLLHSPYFLGEQFTRADIVAGTLIPSLPLDNYPALKAWAEKVNQRESWQKTAPAQADINAALPTIRSILERRA